MNEDMILSEYLDGELPADLARMVEERLRQDAAFKARFEALQSLGARMGAGQALDDAAVEAASVRVWQRLQRNLAPRPSPIPAWLAGLGELLVSRVSLPVPALAGLALVIIAGAGAMLLRPSEAAPAGIAATGGGQAVMSIPANHPSGLPVSALGVAPSAEPDALAASNTASEGLSVTIEVQNLRQLLSVLENSAGIRELSIQLPQQGTLEPQGEPALLNASEIQGFGLGELGK